jgi:hypothetical protein
MTILKAFLLTVALGAVSAQASMIRYDDRADADTLRTQYFDSALSAGPVPRWSMRLTATLGPRREELPTD